MLSDDELTAKIERIPKVIALPFDWYDPDEDAIWEAYLTDELKVSDGKCATHFQKSAETGIAQ